MTTLGTLENSCLGSVIVIEGDPDSRLGMIEMIWPALLMGLVVGSCTRAAGGEVTPGWLMF